MVTIDTVSLSRHKSFKRLVQIPVFDINLNGTKTLSENVADNEGLKIVYEVRLCPFLKYFSCLSHGQMRFIHHQTYNGANKRLIGE